MNDYKELVEKLRCPNFAQKARDEAADAIEQLVKERDAAIADLKINWLCAVCKNKTNESENEWAGCEKERPIHLGLGKKGVTCANFEWRGVGED